MKLSHLYLGIIVFLLVCCVCMKVALTAEQHKSAYFEKEMRTAIRANWLHYCPTNNAK